jgi:hypothetical protein
MLLKKEDIGMRKKIIIFLVSVTCALSLSACADNSQVQSDTRFCPAGHHPLYIAQFLFSIDVLSSVDVRFFTCI